MSKIKVVFKNISWLTVSQIITSVCAFFWTIVIANYLEVEKYGIISFSTSFIGIAIVLVDFGMTTYVTREVSRKQESLRDYANLIFGLKFILSLIVLILSLGALWMWGCSKTTILVTLIFLSEMIIMSFTQFICGIFQAYENLKYQAIGGVINCILLISGVLITIFLNLGIYGIALSYVIGYVGFGTFMSTKYLKRFGWPCPYVDIKKSICIIKKSLPFGITSLFNTIYFWINTVMLSTMKGDYEAGIYKAVFNIIMVFTTLFSVYELVLFPVMSKFYVNKKELIQKSYEKSIKYLLSLSLPMCAGICIYARPIIELIYNKSYSATVVPLKISVWTVVILFLNGVTMMVLNAVNMEKRVTIIYLIGTVINVLLNLILVPKYSYNGAAYATLISVTLIFIILFLQIVRTKFRPKIALVISTVKILRSTTVMVIVLLIYEIPMWSGIIVGILIYGINFLGLGILDEQDKYIFKHLMHKEK